MYADFGQSTLVNEDLVVKNNEEKNINNKNTQNKNQFLDNTVSMKTSIEGTQYYFSPLIKEAWK